MKIFYILLFIIKLAFSNLSAQSGWYQQISHSNNELTSIFFLDINTGLCVGSSGKILKTTNGGERWDSLNSNSVNHLLSICSVNENIYLACGYGRTVLKTTNAGLNWRRITNIGDGTNLNCIQFPDSVTGYIASNVGVLLKSTNAGESWFTLQHPEPFAQSLNSLDFIDINTGYVVGYDGFPPYSPIIKTTNGGINWERQISITSSSLNSIKFITPDIGIICGSFGTIRQTTNGGIFWNHHIFPGTSSTLLDLSFINDSVAYSVGGNGTIIKTINGGLNWNLQNSNTTNHLSGIHFINESTGYAVGANGTILKTTTGGIVNINPIGTLIPEKFKLYQNYPNPFNPTTTIKFNVPQDTRREIREVKLIVLDALGKNIETLVNERLIPGTYSLTFDGSKYNSGVYFYRLITDNYSESKKMLLVK